MKKEKTIRELFEMYGVRMTSYYCAQFSDVSKFNDDLEWLGDFVQIAVDNKSFAKTIFPTMRFKYALTPYIEVSGTINGYKFYMLFCFKCDGRVVLEVLKVDRQYIIGAASKSMFLHKFLNTNDMAARMYLLLGAYSNNLEAVDRNREYETRQLMKKVFGDA